MKGRILQRSRRISPLVFAILMTLLILVFPTASGAVITILDLNELQGKLVQAVAFLFAGMIGCVIANVRYGSWKNVVFHNERKSPMVDYLWFAPLVFVELLPLLNGIEEGLRVNIVLAYLLFTMAVGFTEELYFRGLIVKAFEKRSIVYVIFLSSFLFSVGHFLNLLAGATIGYTALQVIFAFIFGAVAVEISLMSGSLTVPIIWHTAHNFISLLTNVNDSKWFIIIGLVQGMGLILYGVFLWSRMVQKSDKN